MYSYLSKIKFDDAARSRVLYTLYALGRIFVPARVSLLFPSRADDWLCKLTKLEREEKKRKNHGRGIQGKSARKSDIKSKREWDLRALIDFGEKNSPASKENSV